MHIYIYIYIIYESTLVLYMHLHTSYISSLVFGMHTSYELVEYIIYERIFYATREYAYELVLAGTLSTVQHIM